MTRDLRKYANQTNVRAFIGFLLLVFLVGDGLIYLIYGKAAAVSGVICILAGLGPLVLIWLALVFIDLIVKKTNE